MKKTRAIAALFAAILSFSACEISEIENPEPSTVTLKAKIDNTKAFIGGDNFLYWQDGDQIWINGHTYNLSISGDVATIEDVQTAESYIAVYPASMAEGYYDQDDDPRYVAINFPAVQEYRSNGGNQVLDIPLAAYSTSEELTFHCAASLLRVTLSNDKGKDMIVDSVTITPESTMPGVPESFAGSTAIYASDYPLAYAMAVASDGELGATISFSNEELRIANGSSKSFYIPIPILSSSKLTVALNTTDLEDKVYKCQRQTPSAKSLSVNTIADIPMSMSALSEDYDAYFPQGDGTKENPYIITTKEQLKHLRDAVDASKPMNSCAFKLGNDIDFGGDTFYPIGTIQTPFFGSFDGDGHTISNIVLGRRTSGDYSLIGLFGYAELASFSNLTVNASVTISEFTTFAAILCAVCRKHCSFRNITTEGTITTGDAYTGNRAGGILASFQNWKDTVPLFDGCTNKANISVRSSQETCEVGGIIGSDRIAINIYDCVNEGNISLTCSATSYESKAMAGGIVGRLYPDASNTRESFTVDRCRNKGNVSVTAQIDGYAGGLLGGTIDTEKNGPYLDMQPKVSNYVNTGNITAVSNTSECAYAGGAVGHMYCDGPEWEGFKYYPYFHNCLNAGTISATGNDSRTGGMCGRVMDDNTQFVQCVNIGAIKGYGDPHKGAISGGSDGIFDDGGSAYFCCWMDPNLPVIYDDDDGDSNCCCDDCFTSSWLNSRLINFQYINKEFSTNWTNDQWAGIGTIHACPWVGTTEEGNLDINF